jgi:hypothetical protein
LGKRVREGGREKEGRRGGGKDGWKGVDETKR